MEKRLPLALFLSFLVLFAWSVLQPREEAPPPGEEPAAEAGPSAPAGGPSADSGAGAAAAEERPPAIAAAAEETIEIDTGPPGAENGELHPGRFHLVFTNRGGRLAAAQLRDYYVAAGLDEAAQARAENWLTLLRPVAAAAGETGSLLLEPTPSSLPLTGPAGLGEVLWRAREIEGPEPGVEFTYAPGNGLAFAKRITAVPGTWHLRLSLTIENQGAAALAGRHQFVLTPAGCVPAELGDGFYAEPRAAAVGRDGDDYTLDWESAAGAEAEGDRLNAGGGGLAFAGVHNKYFAFFLRDSDPAGRSLLSARYEPVLEPAAVLGGKPAQFIATKILLDLDVPASGSRTWEYTIYAGPKDPAVMVPDFAPHRLVLDKDLSTFSTIGRALLAILGFFHGLVGNWGVAIILLTICVRIALFPLNRRSQTAMARYAKKMKRVQPKLEEIKKRYAGDPAKLREAQARIMQEEGAFPPLGGCLPIFLQIPIFFGLFSALRTSFDLRQAAFFGWMDDLSRPDRLLRLDWEIPLLVTRFDLTYLNLLPLLMVVLWILQQRGMPQPQDEQARRMHKMMMFMPVVFGLLLYTYAAGLSLYMITQSTLGIVEQRVIKKLWPIDDAEPEKVTKERRGCGPFRGALQNIAEKQRQEVRRVEAMRNAHRLQSKKQRKRRR
ncbi:MAG: YidC/Oxa1 family insertase periplasmic-domain containing protein [Planctomycetota bacterium]